MPLFIPIEEKWINPYKVKNFTTLIPVYNKLAKRANQRMRELEKKERKTGESTTYGAYRVAQQALGRKEGAPPKRFKENITWEDTQHGLYEFEQRFLDVQAFLESKTSTITGLKQIKAQREKTWKEKGIKFGTDEEFYNFLNSDLFKSLSEQFDSDTIIEIFDQMKENRTSEEVVKALQGIVDQYQQQQRKLSEKALRALNKPSKKKGFKPRR